MRCSMTSTCIKKIFLLAVKDFDEIVVRLFGGVERPSRYFAEFDGEDGVWTLFFSPLVELVQSLYFYLGPIELPSFHPTHWINYLCTFPHCINPKQLDTRFHSNFLSFNGVNRLALRPRGAENCQFHYK